MNNSTVEWEQRPGGMLAGAGDGGPIINVNILHGPSQFEVLVPAQSTFGDIKRAVWHKVGLKPNEVRLMFRGKEKDDEDQLLVAGVKSGSKVVLLEDPTPEERNLEEVDNQVEVSKSSEVISGVMEEVDTVMENGPDVSVEMSKAFEAVARVRAEVDNLAERVSCLEVAVLSGTKVAEKEFVVSTELLMRQLLNLDSIEAEGEAKVQRKTEVHRVQKLVDSLDSLKARNSNPFNTSNSISVTTQWETFDSGMGSFSAPAPPPVQSSAQVSQDWERFD